MQNELTVNTVEWWLNQITDPIIKRLALGNMDWHQKKIKVLGLSQALRRSFIWLGANEGHDFWEAIELSNDPNITFESVKHLLPENYKLTN